MKLPSVICVLLFFLLAGCPESEAEKQAKKQAEADAASSKPFSIPIGISIFVGIMFCFYLSDVLKAKAKAKQLAEFERQQTLAREESERKQVLARKCSERQQALAREESERQQALAHEESERLRQELDELRQTPTSSSSGVRGRRIVRQIKMIAVDNHLDQDDAERDFLRQVQACGGTGVINMRIRRQRGGYVSIQGDAVVLE